MNFCETLIRELHFTKITRCFIGGFSVTEIKYSM